MHLKQNFGKIPENSGIILERFQKNIKETFKKLLKNLETFLSNSKQIVRKVRLF